MSKEFQARQGDMMFRKVEGPPLGAKAKQDDTLQKENDRLRRLLLDKESGIGLMRSCLFLATAFVLAFFMTHVTGVILLHPIVALIGVGVSAGFFCIGVVNRNKYRKRNNDRGE